MRNTLREEGIVSKISQEDKAKVEGAIDECLKWVLLACWELCLLVYSLLFTDSSRLGKRCRMCRAAATR